MVNDGKCMENNKSGELTVLYFYYKIIINMLTKNKTKLN